MGALQTLAPTEVKLPAVVLAQVGANGAPTGTVVQTKVSPPAIVGKNTRGVPPSAVEPGPAAVSRNAPCAVRAEALWWMGARGAPILGTHASCNLAIQRRSLSARALGCAGIETSLS